MGILLFELFRNPLFMGILNKWETLVTDYIDYRNLHLFTDFSKFRCTFALERDSPEYVTDVGSRESP